MGASQRRLQLLALFVVLLAQFSSAAPGPGYEPGPGGGVKCKKGTYKSSTGNYKCSGCPANTIQPGTGHTKCSACPLDRTANEERTFCKKLPPGTSPRPSPKPTKKPTRKPTRRPTKKPTSMAARIKAEASVYHASFSCKATPGGGKRCGIPVGYAGNPIGYQGLSRTGAYVLPKGYQSRSMPVMVLLHGSGVNGDWMIRPFLAFAEKYRFIIVAPDSREDMYWSNPKSAKDPWTHDWYHIQACYSWVVSQPNVHVNKGYVTVNGNSRAGYTAPAIASRSTVIGATSAIIMHANVLPRTMGFRTFPILWSTGYNDPLYGPKQTNVNRAYFHHDKPQYKVTYRVWQSSHSLNNATEIENICQWFVLSKTRNRPAPPLHGR